MSRATGARRDATKRANGSRRKPGRPIIAGSLNRLTRKGRTACNESGPPRFINTTATRVILFNGVRSRDQPGECRNILRRRFRQHTMAEVEHEWAATERPAQLFDCGFESRAPRDQQHWIEIALNRSELLEPRPGVAGRHHCIETDAIDPGLRNVPLIEQTCATWKTNNRMIRKPAF